MYAFRYTLSLGAALAGCLLTACQKEQSDTAEGTPRVEITIPGFEDASGAAPSAASPATRGMELSRDAELNDIWLLFFDRNADESRAMFRTIRMVYNPDMGASYSQTASGIHFRQNIEFSTTAADDGVDPARSYDVLVLANVAGRVFGAVDEDFDLTADWIERTALMQAAFAGKSLSEVRELLQLDHSLYYDVNGETLGAVPMSDKTIYDPDRKLVESRLRRSMAKVIFRVTETANYFARSVRVANMRRWSYVADPEGKIRPEVLERSFPQSPYVTYAGDREADATVASDLMADPAFDWNASPAQDFVFYCAEAYNDAIETADRATTCLILEARLKDEPEQSRYYRIDLASLNSETGRKWQYIGRNKYYVYTLDLISSAGYDTPGEALDNKPLKVLLPGTSDAGWDDQGTHPTHYLPDGRSLLISLHKVIPKWFFDDSGTDPYYTEQIGLYWSPDAPAVSTLKLHNLQNNPSVSVNGTDLTLLQSDKLSMTNSETLSIVLLKRNLYPVSAGKQDVTFDLTYTPEGQTTSHTFTFTISYY